MQIGVTMDGSRYYSNADRQILVSSQTQHQFCVRDKTQSKLCGSVALYGCVAEVYAV